MFGNIPSNNSLFLTSDPFVAATTSFRQTERHGRLCGDHYKKK